MRKRGELASNFPDVVTRSVKPRSTFFSQYRDNAQQPPFVRHSSEEERCFTKCDHGFVLKLNACLRTNVLIVRKSNFQSTHSDPNSRQDKLLDVCIRGSRAYRVRRVDVETALVYQKNGLLRTHGFCHVPEEGKVHRRNCSQGRFRHNCKGPLNMRLMITTNTHYRSRV